MLDNKHGLHVFGIESTCDDTGAAIIRHDGKIMSNCVISQLKQHLLNGGVIPVIAKEYHLKNIDKVANDAFKQSGLRSFEKDIDAIAVSTRPGMNFSLQVGLNYAKKLAKKYSKPLIPIHHMQAHALMPLLQHKAIRFPFIAMLLSGGHCLLAIVKQYNNFQLLGKTLDEAPGDFLDKFARRSKLRNLGPPFDRISGGASIELLAKQIGADRFKYFGTSKCVPMLRHTNCDFSFSGYRGCLEISEQIVDQLWLQGDHEKLKTELGHLCSSLQRMILIQLVKKLQRAILYFRMHWRYGNSEVFAQNSFAKNNLGYNLLTMGADKDTEGLDIVVSGGVASNDYFIEGIRLACQHSLDPNIRVYVPEKGLCSDNGLMIAWNGLLRLKDFLDDREKFLKSSDEDSIVISTDELNSINIKPECDIGEDLRVHVSKSDFKLSKLEHHEFKLKS